MMDQLFYHFLLIFFVSGKSNPDILLHGHTHVPVIKDCGDYTYINPGSVSIPKENSAHSYLILENGKFTFGDLT